MGIRQEHVPLLLGKLTRVDVPLPVFAGPRLSPKENSCVARIVEDAQRSGMTQGQPHDLSFLGTAPQTPGHEQALSAEVPHGRAGRARALERLEEREEALLHLTIRIQHDPVLFVVHQARGQTHLQFAALGLALDPAFQARPQHVDLGFRHRPLEAQQ